MGIANNYSVLETTYTRPPSASSNAGAAGLPTGTLWAASRGADVDARGHRGWVTALFGATIFVASTLLFMVQPMVAKMLLPLLGGVPAVWNTALVFFQVALLGGYAWAHASSTRLSLRPLLITQAGIFVLAAATLPVAMPDGWQPDTSRPMWWALSALLVAVGLPFFALSTSSPMLQRWYSRTSQRRAHDPYFLYATSNAGSLVGLAGYPLVLEPALDLGGQARVWGWVFVLLVCMMVASGIVTWWRRVPDVVPARPERTEPIATHSRLRWVILAAVPAALLLGVTQHISTDVASFPLLWVVPLAIYLVTFIVAFGSNPEWLRRWAGHVLKLAAIPLAITLVGAVPLWLDVALGLIVLTSAALVCHGQLAASRPEVSRLTEYYLLISVGGAAGGTATAIIAPQIFPIVLEYPLAVALSLALLPAALFRGVAARFMQLGIMIVMIVAAIAGLAVAAEGFARIAVVIWVGGLLAYMLTARPWHYAVIVGIALVAAPFYPVTDADYFDRSFFGTLRVDRTDGFLRLSSGTTTHGAQAIGSNDPAPTSYYYDAGPVGDVFDLRGDDPLDGMVIGLGAGTIAAYGQPGDTMVFLEIDPLMAAVARERFSFLEASEAEVEVRIGDGRLLLEASPERFDLVVVDAFTSDSIPVHLMTREAMEAYVDSTVDGGLVAYHVSNRYMELWPVIGRQADDLGYAALVTSHASDVDTIAGSDSTWVVVARSESTLAPLGANWEPIAAETAPLWTDAYSNLLQVIRLW